MRAPLARLFLLAYSFHFHPLSLSSNRLTRLIGAPRHLLLSVQHPRVDTGHRGLASETGGNRNAPAVSMFQLIAASGQLTLSALGTAPLFLGMNQYSYTYRLN